MSSTGEGPLPSVSFWRERKVLVTGHTGFKGSWLCAWLDQLGAEVMGVSLPERPTDPSLWDELDLTSVRSIEADITADGWQQKVVAYQPDIVFHLAAQPLVSRGYEQPLRTFATNVYGSALLLDTLSALNSLSAAIMVTTDKVYDARQPTPFVEDSFLGGSDPYSASKTAMEFVVHAWPQLPFAVATARAGNVIGGGDWTADRLLPDLIASWSAGSPVKLRRPSAVRPWQHVLEPLRGYLLYAEALTSAADVPPALNLGPDESQCIAVEELVEFAAACWAETTATSKAPAWTAFDEPPMHETEQLLLDSSAAREAIRWSNVLDWRTAVAQTIAWHRNHATGTPARELVLSGIAEYERLVETGP